MTSNAIWSEEDILGRLKDNAEDEHRNFIEPEEAQAILKLLQAKDKEIARLKEPLPWWHWIAKG